MALTDKERDELLAKISHKIDSSTVLNGGFDKLVTIVESIKQRQSEQTDTLDQINTRLYEPKEGLFSRVQQLENDTDVLSNKVARDAQENNANFGKIEKYFEKVEEIKSTAAESANVTSRLQRIGGKDLESIEKSVDLNKKLSSLYWALLLLGLSGIGNVVWQLVTHR